jgi:endonuclease/exonuclease/phosphatase family metal-dependent hydrolase
MRLISWNIKHGGGGRITEQIESLAARLPDIVALQEVMPKSAPVLHALLSEAGLPHACDSFELAPNRSLLTGPRRYGEFIASRWPICALPPNEFIIPWPERVLSVSASSPWGDVEVHTTHIPPGITNDWTKIETLEGIFKRLALKTSKKRILCGDFNTPQTESEDGQSFTWGQKIERNGEVKLWKARSGNRGERWDLGERNILIGLGAYDLPDIFRVLHDFGVQEFSWYWRGKGTPVGRRYDHVFASSSLNAVRCEYLHALREKGLSDHSPIEVLFEPKMEEIKK